MPVGPLNLITFAMGGTPRAGSQQYNLPLIPFCVFIFHLKYYHLQLQKFYVYLLLYLLFFFFHLAYSIISLASWMSSVQLHNYFVFVYYFCHLCHLGLISPLFSSLLSPLTLCLVDSNHLYLPKPSTQAHQQSLPCSSWAPHAVHCPGNFLKKVS